MSEFFVYVGSFAGSVVLASMAWWMVSRSVAAENAVEIEEWERT